MEDKPLVTVVIPAYNRASTLAACLQSIRAQTFHNWEAIVVDDGSSDNTRQIVVQLQRDDARIRFFRQDCNRGAQAARNMGIHAAKGEWIAFLDSDDQFLPHSLETRLEVATTKNLPVVHSECNVVQIDGSMTRYGVPPLTGLVYQQLLEREGPVFPGLLVLKDCLKKINYLDEQIVAFQEWDTAIRLAKHYPFGFEPRPTFNYNCRQPDTISKQMLRGGRGYEQVFHKHYFGILRYGGPAVLARHYRVAASWYQAGGDQKAVRRCTVMALMCSFFDPQRIRRNLRSTANRLLSKQQLLPARPAPLLFKQKCYLDKARSTVELSKLLGVRIRHVNSEFQGTGHSGHVHKLEFLDDHGERRRVIIKKATNLSAYVFYKDVLEPLRLDSPKMYGHIEINDDLFLVMEYIPHLPIQWENEKRFTAAVNWLIKKDTIVNDNLDKVQESVSIKSFSASVPFARRIDECIKILNEGSNSGLSSFLPRHFVQTVVEKKDLLRQLSTRISKNARVTLCHYDFQMNNILFTHQGSELKLYVIDWSGPHVDSACVDLIGLVHCAPQAVRQKLIDQYRSKIDFENFDGIYHAAELLISLSELAWTIEMIKDGQSKSCSMAEFESKSREVGNKLFSLSEARV